MTETKIEIDPYNCTTIYIQKDNYIPLKIDIDINDPYNCNLYTYYIQTEK